MTAAIHAALAEAREARAAGLLDGAAIGYARAAEMARSAQEHRLLAHALRHVSDIARERDAFALALTSGTEAIALYRAHPDDAPLDLANALRVTALALQCLDRNEEAAPLWSEARDLYARAQVVEAVDECTIALKGR